MKIGLRIDADTFRGTQYGVPRLIQLLSKTSISASFFFSVGPDNMGRHLWRLIRPDFFRKMMRSKAPALYGWGILLRGTLWPGPVIGEKLAGIIRSASVAGHEAGFHAWDHHSWQVRVDRMTGRELNLSFKRGIDMLTNILGRPPACSAVPSWRCTDLALLEKERFPLRYNSDCRGKSLFYPVVGGEVLSQPQIPVTLPTYDEVIGRDGVSDRNYNEHLISLLKPDRLNVMTVHAEVEGMACYVMFESFLKTARSRGASFVPLGAFLEKDPVIGRAKIINGWVKGREGWVSCQSSEKEDTRSGS
jgi:undecaprenyl phosphate-alpha-L-ara4FN deformylase